MINELKLKWNELYVYAVIYSFTNWTDDHYFNWSLSYLSEWTNQSVRNVQNNLKSLLDKWLITKDERYENWVKFVRYKTTYGKNFQGLEKISENYGKNFQGGMEKISNNISSNIYNNTQEESTSDFESALNDLIEARKKLKKPMTERAIRLVRNKLEKMYPWDTEMQIICINQSIERWWQSVFEVKDEDLKYYKKQPKQKKTINFVFT